MQELDQSLSKEFETDIDVPKALLVCSRPPVHSHRQLLARWKRHVCKLKCMVEDLCWDLRMCSDSVYAAVGVVVEEHFARKRNRDKQDVACSQCLFSLEFKQPEGLYCERENSPHWC